MREGGGKWHRRIGDSRRHSAGGSGGLGKIAQYLRHIDWLFCAGIFNGIEGQHLRPGGMQTRCRARRTSKCTRWPRQKLCVDAP